MSKAENKLAEESSERICAWCSAGSPAPSWLQRGNHWFCRVSCELQYQDQFGVFPAEADAQREPELLPCPFCGGKASGSLTGNENGGIYIDRWAIHCRSCNFEMIEMAVEGESSPWYLGAQSRLILKWNTRSRPTVEAAEIPDELVDEVQRRMDAVVNAAVEWHQDEGEEWSQKAEILGDAIEALLELREAARDAAPTPPEKDSEIEATEG